MGDMVSGGQRYWNEETQRWEGGIQETAHATAPPPGRPDHDPTVAAVSHGGDEGGLPPAHSEPSPAPPPPSPGPASWPSGPYRPPADQPSVPAAADRFDRRRVWAAVAAGAAVVGVAVGLALTQANGDGGRDEKASASVTPTLSAETFASEPAGAATQDTLSPSPSTAGLPTGYESFDDPEGFRTAVPEGWQRDAVPSQYGMDVVNYRSPDGEQRIQVFQVAEATPQESFDLFLSPDTPKADSFRELGREDLSDGDFVGERLEYLVGSLRGEPDVGTWHVVDTRFAATDGTLYAVAVYGRDGDGWSDEVEMADTAVGWFCPPGGICAG